MVASVMAVENVLLSLLFENGVFVVCPYSLVNVIVQPIFHVRDHRRGTALGWTAANGRGSEHGGEEAEVARWRRCAPAARPSNTANPACVGVRGKGGALGSRLMFSNRVQERRQDGDVEILGI